MEGGARVCVFFCLAGIVDNWQGSLRREQYFAKQRMSKMDIWIRSARVGAVCAFWLHGLRGGLVYGEREGGTRVWRQEFSTFVRVCDRCGCFVLSLLISRFRVLFFGE